MIYSTNNQAQYSDFEDFLSKSQNRVELDSQSRADYYLNRGGRKFEDDLYDIMTDMARGTVFENTIAKISGQKFPDIVINRFYGVEVKTTTQNHWKSTGNSVFENTRVEGVEKIYLFFGKLSDPIGFRWRKYEECLYEIAVTHSPRYLIDMNLIEEQTIFNKINVPYDELRQLENPIQPIREYYKQFCKTGEQLWWMEENGETPSQEMILRFWTHLEPAKKKSLTAEAMVLFPQIFGKRQTKFDEVSLWLLKTHNILNSRLRDTFTAGGKRDITINLQTYRVPAIIERLYRLKPEVLKILRSTKVETLEEQWRIKLHGADPVTKWIELCQDEAQDFLLESNVTIPLLIS
jgi:hypothetical protein